MHNMNCKAMAVAAVGVALLAVSPVSALDKLTVAYFLEWPTPNLVAQVEKTYDEALGVPVEWRAFGNGNEMSLAMASGEVHIAYAQGVIPWLVAVSNGLPLQLVGIADSYAEGDNCVVRNGAGITQANATELEGKRVATPIGNVTHYKLLRVLDHLGVDVAKVELVQMNGADAAVALARGDVTMACAFGGPLRRMKEFGAELMTAAEQEAIGIRVFDVISVTKQFADDHPELLRKFMQVTEQANAAYAADPGQLEATIADAAGMELDAARWFLAAFSFPSVAEQQSPAWLGGGVQTFAKAVAEFLAAQGQLERALKSYEFAIDPSFL